MHIASFIFLVTPGDSLSITVKHSGLMMPYGVTVVVYRGLGLKVLL